MYRIAALHRCTALHKAMLDVHAPLTLQAQLQQPYSTPTEMEASLSGQGYVCDGERANCYLFRVAQGAWTCTCAGRRLRRCLCTTFALQTECSDAYRTELGTLQVVQALYCTSKAPPARVAFRMSDTSAL